MIAPKFKPTTGCCRLESRLQLMPVPLAFPLTSLAICGHPLVRALGEAVSSGNFVTQVQLLPACWKTSRHQPCLLLLPVRPCIGLSLLERNLANACRAQIAEPARPLSTELETLSQSSASGRFEIARRHLPFTGPGPGRHPRRNLELQVPCSVGAHPVMFQDQQPAAATPAEARRHLRIHTLHSCFARGPSGHHIRIISCKD